LFWRGVAGDDGIVNPVHPQSDRPAALHVGLFEQQYRAMGQRFFRFDRRGATGGAAADHEDVDIEIWVEVFHRLQPASGKRIKYIGQVEKAMILMGS
jgi:hypothetical protein